MAIPEELKPYAARLGFPESATLGRILTLLFGDELSLRVAKALPGSVGEISERTGLSRREVEAVTARLKMTGAINRVIVKGDYYRLFPAMIEIRDSTLMYEGSPQELYELWDRLVTCEMPTLVPMLRELKVPPMMRVVPIEKTVSAQGTVLDMDSARKIVREAELITAVPCPCRLQAKKAGKGKGCPAPEENLCLQINGFAEAVADRGIGERLSVNEALKRLGDAEDAGLVHQVRNNVKRDMFMCNCCSCCCTALFMLNGLGYEASVAKSRFRVRLNAELCTGCGVCEDRCHFHAIEVNGTAKTKEDKCFGCGSCALYCPEGALTLEEVRPREHIRTT